MLAEMFFWAWRIAILLFLAYIAFVVTSIEQEIYEGIHERSETDVRRDLHGLRPESREAEHVSES